MQEALLKDDFTSGKSDIRIVKDNTCIDKQGLNYLIPEEIGSILEKSGKKADVIDLYKMGLNSCHSDMCKETMNKNIRGK